MAPRKSGNDPRPIVTNNGTAGARAAFLLLPQLGYKVERWDAPEDQLDHVDASKTTLIMADVYIDPKQQKLTEAAVKRFLERGGRVLDTGGGTLLPNGETRPATAQHTDLCYTTPEGQGPLAQAGQLSMADNGMWNEKDSKLGPALHVEQRCGEDAVVVRYAVGKGEAIWWSSSKPLTNAGLREDANLRLLLATVGASGRTVLFDEYSHGAAPGFWDAAKDLPLRWLVAQFVLIALLLILSFSRRNGPLRMPVTPVPRHLAGGVCRVHGPPLPARRKYQRRHRHGPPPPRCASCNPSVAWLALPLTRALQPVAEALQGRFGGDWARPAPPSGRCRPRPKAPRSHPQAL